MTEEIMNINTDLKELFSDLKTEDMITILDQQPDETVKEITSYNFDIIKKYYDAQKYELLKQYIKFVAFTSFLCDYTVKRQLIETEVYTTMNSLFESILEILRK